MPVPGDLREPESLARLVEGCEVVFHLAAWILRCRRLPFLHKQAESADLGERVTALERLAALQPDPETFSRLAVAAFDAGRCAVAGYASASILSRNDILAGYDVEACERAYGCRGTLAEVQFVTPSDEDLAADRAAPDACAADVEVDMPCGFCTLAYGDEKSPEGLKAKERIRKKTAAVKQRRARLDALCGQGPYLHVRLRRRGETGAALRGPDPAGDIL